MQQNNPCQRSVWNWADKETEGLRSKRRWFWGVEVIAGGVIASGSAWFLWDRSTLEGWQVGLITFGVFAGTLVLIYCLIFLVNLIRAPRKLRRECEIELAKRLGSISVTDPRDQMMIQRWLQSRFGDFNLSVARVAHPDNGFEIRLAIESEADWPLIQKRLRKSHLLKDLDTWKSLTVNDLNARKALLEAIHEKVKSEFSLPIQLDDSYLVNVDKDPKPYLTGQFIVQLFDQLFSKLAGIDNAPLQKWSIECDDDKGVLYFPNRMYPLICSDDSKKRDDVVEWLISASTKFSDLPEAQNAREAYAQAKDKSVTLKKEFAEIRSSEKARG